ncbi:MAG: hypothetical protein JW836_09830 [Deltaproteobacteria bacterium]|nr:hypothetical protein [Deltaproteobacteria bacterium]
MDWNVLIVEGMWLLGTLIVGFLAATIFLLIGVIPWSEDDLLWFLPLCAGIAYGGRIAVWSIKTRTDSTRLAEAIKIIIKSF